MFNDNISVAVITLYFFGDYEYIGGCFLCYNTTYVDMLHRLQGTKYSHDIYQEIYGMDFPNRVLRVEILNPAYLINADLAFENTFGVNVAVLYCALLIVVLAMIYAIYRWMNRKVYG